MINIIRTSENTVLILFEQVIESDNFALINQLVHRIKEEMANNIIDIIPSYASVHITFNLLKISGMEFKQCIERLLYAPQNKESKEEEATIIEIPVYYGEDVALDLKYIAEKNNLSESEVIEIHSSKVYDVYAIGFAPGFAYLGNVDDSIATSRKETPRQKVARGSVGIADQQTAIYPSESPGGWQIVGRTPVQLIDYSSENLTQFSTGDKVKFNSISQSEYINMGGKL